MFRIFDIFSMGREGLFAQQAAIQVSGHNVSNADTPGYARQRVDLKTALAINYPKIGKVPRGVRVDGIVNLRDKFLDQQFRNQSMQLGTWKSKSKALDQLQVIFQEPSDVALNQAITDYFNAWSELSDNPEDIASRINLNGKAEILTNNFHLLDGKIRKLIEDVDKEVVNYADQINQIGNEVAALNYEIARLEIDGKPANDLRDRRDQLVDDLSEIVNCNVTEEPDGTLIVRIGGLFLVDGDNAAQLIKRIDSTNEVPITKLFWDNNNLEFTPTNGLIKGSIEARDEILPSFAEQIDQLAYNLIIKVNQYHRRGWGLDGSRGFDYFSGTDSRTIDISLPIKNNVERIAASLDGAPGDNENALDIANLLNELTMNNNTASFSEYYQSFIGKLGVETSESYTREEAHAAMVLDVTNKRQSVMGVSLDEEASDLIKFQHIYQAMARVINVADSLLDTIINGLG